MWMGTIHIIDWFCRSDALVWSTIIENTVNVLKRSHTNLSQQSKFDVMISYPISASSWSPKRRKGVMKMIITHIFTLSSTRVALYSVSISTYNTTINRVN